MKEIWAGKSAKNAESGEPITCEYTILVEERGESFFFESYGIRVAILETGESDELWDITVNTVEIGELADLLHRNGVTPCTMRDVIQDWMP